LIFVGASNKDVYETWFAKALADDGVWPYMSFDKRWVPNTVDSDDWDRLLILDDSKTALLRWTNDRSNGLHDASLSLWALSGPQKRIAAGRLASLIPMLARRYGVSFVEAACHASNVDSIRLMTRRLGQPWGRKVAAGWNGMTGHFEDTLHFRAATDKLKRQGVSE